VPSFCLLSGVGQLAVQANVAHPAAEPRYVFAGDAPDDVATDRGTGLTWQRRPSTTTYSFAEAKAYCAALTSGGGGFRGPSMKELQAVLDERAPSYTDASVFPDYPTTLNPTFWTSTPSARSPDDAWFVRGGSTLNVAADAGVGAKFYEVARTLNFATVTAGRPRTGLRTRRKHTQRRSLRPAPLRQNLDTHLR
jgi:hypothetical protein